MNTKLEKRICQLEEATGVDDMKPPSLILITALGREADELRGVRLSCGLTLLRHASESATDFSRRANAWAATPGARMVKLGTAIYDVNEAEAGQ